MIEQHRDLKDVKCQKTWVTVPSDPNWAITYHLQTCFLSRRGAYLFFLFRMTKKIL